MIQMFSPIHADKHTHYMACSQAIKWNTEILAGKPSPNGAIIQHIKRTEIVNGCMVKEEEYYEAWIVNDGICTDTKGQEYDDLFSIGHPLNSFDELCLSIYKSGEIRFQASFCWVDELEPIYQIVLNWPRLVASAGGLLSIYSHTRDKEELQSLSWHTRDEFLHVWDLTDESQVQKEMSGYCRKMYKGRKKDLDRANLKLDLEQACRNGLPITICEYIIHEYETDWMEDNES